MTDVVSREVHKTCYEWIVPVHWREHAMIGTVVDAIAMAREVAKSHGINTTTDDWLRLRCEDEQVVFYFEAERKPG